MVVPTATGEQVGHAVQQRLAPRLAQAQAEVGQLGGAADTDAITHARDGDLEGAGPVADAEGGTDGRDQDLTEFAEAVLAMPPLAGIDAKLPADPSGDPLDFNGAGTNRGGVTELLGQLVREGGIDGLTRFDALSKIIGYWIRRCQDGVVTAAQASQEICNYNAARISPPWPEDRLRHEAERLWRRAEANHPAEPQPANDAAGAGDNGDGPDDLLPIGFTEDA